MPSESSLLSRAGFWRRSCALAVDLMIGGLVIAVLGTMAYYLSFGSVQTAPFAVNISNCASVAKIPANLNPSPPQDSNYGFDCSSGSFPGMTMKRVLIVGRKVTSDGREMKTWQSYPLAPDGSRVAAFDASWIVQLGFLVYLASALYFRGRTLGMRLLNIHMICLFDPERNGIPLLSILLRFAVAILGFLPAIFLGIAAILWTLHDAEHAPTLALTLTSLILAAVWSLWNTILIGRKLDPIYDRTSRLAVVRS